MRITYVFKIYPNLFQEFFASLVTIYALSKDVFLIPFPSHFPDGSPNRGSNTELYYLYIYL